MGNSKLRGKDLARIGIINNAEKSIALDILLKHFKKTSKSEQLKLLCKIQDRPSDFLLDERFASLAKMWSPAEDQDSPITYKEAILRSEAREFSVFGQKGIEQNAIRQMQQVMQLPIAEKGALMPDAHQGYGLPIGGVLATKNCVLPYGVGMDIGCRMRLSILDSKKDFVKRYKHQVKQVLLENTHFGNETDTSRNIEHEVLDRQEFQLTPLARKLHGKACKQLGTSGSGNHFVELGIVKLYENNTLGLEAGEYTGILSHSGSRGFGAEIAQHYTQVAMQQIVLPKGYKHLAWLDLNNEAGAEYWALMNLAGDYAKACHEVIHQSIAKALGLKTISKIENHHNFAWKEHIDGEEYIVHRKGATPAASGVHGIIPGSMTAPGFLVSGKGNVAALQSAAHGAGRKVARKKARESITSSSLRKHLKQEQVELIGGQVDEAPIVYKDIFQVMAMQKDLVHTEGEFWPKVVRMDKK